MRIAAIVGAYNEELVLGACLENLARQGVEFLVLDNDSTDRTHAIASSFGGRGLIGIERLPRHGTFRLIDQLRRKEQLAHELDADWVMHVDADEIRLAPDSSSTLARAVAEVDAAGFNAINFQEFTFLPVLEAPQHAAADFERTMRWYYPFLPKPNHRLNLWKKPRKPVDLVTHAGHRVKFAGMRIAPKAFPMRHYPFLSREQAVEKYAHRSFDEAERRRRWHGWRGRLSPEMIQLPAASELRLYTSDDALDASEPRKTHILEDRLERARPGSRPVKPTGLARWIERIAWRLRRL